jgi:uncharacterized membrane protein
MNSAAAPEKNIMAMRISKALPRFFAALVSGGLVMGVLVFLAVQAMPIFGWILWIVAIVAVAIGALLWYQREFAKLRQTEEETRTITRQKESDRTKAELRRQRGLRRTELMTKYAGDQNLVERIVQGFYWEGQTAGELKDSLGNPADIAAKILKRKRNEVWKYHATGGDRYELWIELEDDLVVRWAEHV